MLLDDTGEYLTLHLERLRCEFYAGAFKDIAVWRKFSGGMIPVQIHSREQIRTTKAERYFLAGAGPP